MGLLKRLMAIVACGSVLFGAFGAETGYANPDQRHSIAVVIGNQKYGSDLPAVPFARRDAKDVSRFVVETLGYRDGNVLELIDAKQSDLTSTFGNADNHEGKLWSWMRPGRSDVFVYYSGHGISGQGNNKRYLVPVDGDPTTIELNGYSLDLLLDNLKKLKARSVTVVLDTSFSGSTPDGWLIKAASPVYAAGAPPVVAEGITLITATQDEEVANWDRQNRNGLFTRFFLQGLGGSADTGPEGNKDGSVTVGELQSYLDDEMSYTARRNFSGVQRASFTGDPSVVLVADYTTKQPVSPRPAPAYSPPARTGDSAPQVAVLQPNAPNFLQNERFVSREQRIFEMQKVIRENREAVVAEIERFFNTEGYSYAKNLGGGSTGNENPRFSNLRNMYVSNAHNNLVDLQISFSWKTSSDSGSLNMGFIAAILPEGIVGLRLSPYRPLERVHYLRYFTPQHVEEAKHAALGTTKSTGVSGSFTLPNGDNRVAEKIASEQVDAIRNMFLKEYKDSGGVWDTPEHAGNERSEGISRIDKFQFKGVSGNQLQYFVEYKYKIRWDTYYGYLSFGVEVEPDGLKFAKFWR